MRSVNLIFLCSLLLACQSSNTSLQSDQGTQLSNEQATCSPNALPSQANQILCREGFMVGFNYLNGVADWVSYLLTPSSIAGFSSDASFSTDMELPLAAQVMPDDYQGSGYDRGHLAPAASMDFSTRSNQQSFLMSNIAPQLADFNRQGWADLEAWERRCVQQLGSLQVITGPLYQTQDNTWIKNKVRVPSAYFKAYHSTHVAGAAMAFIIPHQNFAFSDIAQHQVSLAQLERESGLSLFQTSQVDRDTINSWCQLTDAPPPAATALSCQDKYYCSQMQSCEEAQFYLNSCGIDRLDKDGDGVACESLCY